MKGVYHIEVPNISRSGLIGDIYRMFEREIPYGEGFELGISRLQTHFVIMIKLGKTGSQLATGRSRCGDDNQLVFSLNILIGAIALIADYGIYIRRITLGEAVGISPDSLPLQLIPEMNSRGWLSKRVITTPATSRFHSLKSSISFKTFIS